MFQFMSWIRLLQEYCSRNARRMKKRTETQQLQATVLEDRVVPTADLNLVIKAGHQHLSSGFSGTGLTPAQIREAYGVGLITFASSLGSVSGDGSGQTIAIVDAYDDPDIASDLKVFDNQFDLPAPPSLVKLNEYGSTTNLPKGNESDAVETSLDVEWAHAIAPGANIVLIEANNAGVGLNTAMQTAENLLEVTVISSSWGYDYEVKNEISQDAIYTTPSGHEGVTILNASGDNGSSALGTPDTSPDVVTVGGTTLKLGSNGTYGSETAWSGSTGGISTIEPEPVYQQGVQSTGFHTAPDVAFDANPDSGVDVYDSYEPSGEAGWATIGGTSLAAPCWAGLIAIVDQGRALAGEASLDGATETLPALYSLPASDFHDVTRGSNGGFHAGTGYDEVTGLGTPMANQLVADLASMDFMPDGEVGQSYDQTISTANGTTVSYSLTDPTSKVTPASLGLVFSTSGNQLSIMGNPTGTGTFGFTVTSSGSSGTTTQLETLTIEPDLTLDPNPSVIPGANVGATYSQSISTAGGTGDVTLSDKTTSSTTAASLGLALSIRGTTLEITGRPTHLGVLSFDVTATDAFGSVTRGYTVDVGLTLSPLTLESGATGVAYNQTIAAKGGSGTTTVTNIITSLTSPAELGLTFTDSGSNLKIAGTPTAEGTVSFNVVAKDAAGHVAVSYYTLTVGPSGLPVIETDPANTAVDAGGTASFAASVIESGPTLLLVQWEISTDGGQSFAPLDPSDVDGNSVTTDTLSIPDVTAAMNGDEYRAVFSNSDNVSIATAPASLTVDFAPGVMSPPSSATTDSGANASFTAQPTAGNPAATTVRWQISTNGGTSFTNLAAGGVYGNSVTKDTLTVTHATAAMNGDHYRAVFSNAASLSVTTDPATLTVDFATAATGKPSNDAVNSGGNSSFTAAASGNPAPTAQWQISTNGGKTFTDLTAGGVYGGSVNSTTLTITGATASMNGDRYRAVFSNLLANSTTLHTATTSSAILTVNAPAVIAGTQSNQSLAETKTIHPFSEVTISAAGNPAETQDLQIVLSDPANGTFSDRSGGSYDAATGTYTLNHLTLAQTQAVLRALLFVPASQQIPTGETVTTTFAISLTDSAGTATDDITSVIVG